MEFRLAFEQIRPRPNLAQLRMLEIHLGRARHRITAESLARRVGYKNWKAVNLHYGKVGTYLSSVTHYKPGQASSAFAVFYAPRGASRPQWIWDMLPEVAVALKELAWFPLTEDDHWREAAS